MMTREQLIKECVRLTYELEGVKVSEEKFNVMTIEKLVVEYNWLWEMVHLK
ncbi:hypothetical protein CPT_Stahl1 [Bacillus phage Stahl]|uniref:Uncharacterized protein n=1 Tax=Bacillus phage Stahl TaxID=1610832 RepID=A0A0E3GMM7_9CAUD|nr:hypothetical protein CPT_Stahl1 [Bacillus phage Stahl]AKA61429.1 hypothetical protein CPT_Stahl1 [Bacillus phage Stahl]